MVDLCVGSSLIGIYLRVTNFFTKKGPSFKIKIQGQVLSLKRLKRFYLVILESISDDPSHFYWQTSTVSDVCLPGASEQGCSKSGVVPSI